jgi:uncharacterized protein (DUF1697 family)
MAPRQTTPGSSSTRVALLRGVNVGRAKRVAMADLRKLVAELGYGDVRTLLNSGNVVFTMPGTSRGNPGPRIEKALAEALGVTSRVTVLTVRELAEAIDGNPLLSRAADPSRLLVVVLADTADRARVAPLARESWSPEAVAVGRRVVYLWCPEGILASRLVEAVGRALGDRSTARNWSTMTRLLALARSGGPARPLTA